MIVRSGGSICQEEEDSTNYSVDYRIISVFSSPWHIFQFWIIKSNMIHWLLSKDQSNRNECQTRKGKIATVFLLSWFCLTDGQTWTWYSNMHLLDRNVSGRARRIASFSPRYILYYRLYVFSISRSRPLWHLEADVDSCGLERKVDSVLSNFQHPHDVVGWSNFKGSRCKHTPDVNFLSARRGSIEPDGKHWLLIIDEQMKN